LHKVTYIHILMTMDISIIGEREREREIDENLILLKVTYIHILITMDISIIGEREMRERERERERN